jgi:hypothetical protein
MRRGDPSHILDGFFELEFIMDSGDHLTAELKSERPRDDSLRWLRYQLTKFPRHRLLKSGIGFSNLA